MERVVLVGFMGAGKTTVGRLVSHALGWRFVDQDQEVEAVEGRTVSEIFAETGEAHFREVEDQVAQRLLGQKGLVIGTGGGWGAGSVLAALPPHTLSVWLRVSAEEAVRRTSVAADKRPLLATEDALETARMLLAERTPFYRVAHLEVDTEALKPEDVSARILEFMANPNHEMEASENAIT